MSLDPARARPWHRLKIGPIWVAREIERASQAPVSTPGAAPDADAPREVRISRMPWDELREAVASCTACGLCKTRKQAVFGVGHRGALLPEPAKWERVGLLLRHQHEPSDRSEIGHTQKAEPYEDKRKR